MPASARASDHLGAPGAISPPVAPGAINDLIPPPASWGSTRPPAAVPEPDSESPSRPLSTHRRWVKWLVTVLTATSLSIGGVTLLPDLRGGGDDKPDHPSAPFGRSFPPIQRSGAGIALVSPFGYEWADDGSLTVEAWAYNATRFPQVAECEVTILSDGRLVAQQTFSPAGALRPNSAEVVGITFSPDKAPGRFARLDTSESKFSCRAHSV
jgi:hypothetical protein